ncbi:MAG: MFS transporter, partial [Actinomycetota bacterium]
MGRPSIGSYSRAPSAPTGRQERASYLALFRGRSFFRFFLSQGFSSLGDWIGMIAVLTLARRLTQDEFAVAAMLLARLIPALFFGPLAGVIVDRWNRKRVMVACDLGRAVLVATLPFVEQIGRAIPWLRPVVVLFVVSAALEVLTLLWQPAQAASLPHMVPRRELLHANSLMLLGAYGTFPVSGAAFSLLAGLSRWLGGAFDLFRTLRINEEHLAFFFDAFTFTVSALITATLAIPRGRRSVKPFDLRQIWEELGEGIRFIKDHPLVRPWVLGIATIYGGVGIFMAVSVFHTGEVLGAGAAGFGLLVTAVGIGLGLGFASAGVSSRLAARDVLFSITVFGLGFALMAFASVSTLSVGLLLGGILGAFAGLAYPSGLTLVQQNVRDELRGRTLASMYSAVRLV